MDHDLIDQAAQQGLFVRLTDQALLPELRQVLPNCKEQQIPSTRRGSRTLSNGSA
jgi:hypothetical protein